MPAGQRGYPISSITDFLLGYLQNVIFNNPDITPTEWLYNTVNERTSRIRISAPFVIDSDKPLSQPFIVIERGDFTFQHIINNDRKSADANTCDNEVRTFLPRGAIVMTCGSASGQEATNIANFLQLIIQASSPQIKSYSKMITKMNCRTIGGEVPAYRGQTVQRYEVTAIFDTQIQYGFLFLEQDSTTFNKFSVRGIRKPYEHMSENGETIENSNIFVDNTVKFGEDIIFVPDELLEGYYNVELDSQRDYQLVIESINKEPGEDWGYSINLKRKKSDGTFVPWNATANDKNLRYKISWNQMHLEFNYPGNG